MPVPGVPSSSTGGPALHNHFHIMDNVLLGRDTAVAQQLADIIAPELRRKISYHVR